MLRSFRVANHKSFRDEAELLLLPAYDKSRPALPVAGVFGANASGKSNLLDAVNWLQRAVRESYARWEPGSGIPRAPFRLDPAVAAQPSGYCVQLQLGGQRYTYGVEVDDDRVVSEWLYTYPRNRRRIIFERERDDIRLGSTVTDHRSRGRQLAAQTRDNALFLSVAAHNNLTDSSLVYDWFRAKVTFPDGANVTGEELRRRLADEDQRAMMVELVSAADLGISDLTGLRAQDPEDASTQMRLLAEALGTPEAEMGRPTVLRFHHGDAQVPFGLEDESDGTRSWVGLLSAALETMTTGGVMIIDEIDASLHPHLTARLIQLFRDDEVNPDGAQLLFTTHDPTLLDEDTLGRDEVWFVEKSPDSGASGLYPLTDFYPRKHEDRQRRYLAGSYGAVPVVSDHRLRRALAACGTGDVAA